MFILINDEDFNSNFQLILNQLKISIQIYNLFLTNHLFFSGIRNC